jgi:hypothetical protein
VLPGLWIGYDEESDGQELVNAVEVDTALPVIVDVVAVVVDAEGVVDTMLLLLS